MIVGDHEFREVWVADFEFAAQTGERPEPLCLAARELGSGQIVRVWQDELFQLPRPPYSIGKDCLFVAYYASAEMGCHATLGWQMPENVLDLFAEFKCQTNGRLVPCGHGLLGALAFYGLGGIAAAEKGEPPLAFFK